MPVFDDDPEAPLARKVAHEIGQDLSRLSIEDLTARVALLRDEIARLEMAVETKSAQMSAADLLFRR